MDSSVQPSDVGNGTDPFEQLAELVRQGLDGLRSLHDQQCNKIQSLQQEEARLRDEVRELQAELAEARQRIEQFGSAATTAQSAGEQPPAEEAAVPSTGPAARRQNVELRNRIKELEAEIAALQQEPTEPAAIESLRQETEQLKKTNEENEARLAIPQTELEVARQQLRATEQELEAQRKQISRLDRRLHRSKKALDRMREDLDSERATNQELRQDLDAAKQAEQAIQHDLEICKSSRDQLARQVEDLQLAVRKEREQAGWEMATRLTAVLTKLSALAHLEPDQVLGLSERAVFEEFRTELGRAAGGRLEPFPSKHELVDNVLWLDADQNGLDALQARYEWSPERPFEGLPPGSRRLAFRLSRRGWSVGDRVLQRAHVVPVQMEQGPTQGLESGEPAAEPRQRLDKIGADDS